ncbi:hypothetical protein [Lewinella sp. IMCC34183]|uniref:hypothetical protein n=1 Tax=Lewinella sp. IMCC34183 TaxID=2248762 RepID=UPI000E21E06D|nr:hypothetical protein [Lewinella sp. IMCC34183]
MKHLWLGLVLLASTQQLFARVLRVNNSVNSTAEYTDLTTAHAAAEAGDTLMVEGSSIGYGRLTITKQLTIIGPGYFLGENAKAPASLSAIVGQFFIKPGENNDPSAGGVGTEIIGLSFTEEDNTSIIVSANNVLIAKCFLSRDIYIGNVNAITIVQNFSIASYALRFANAFGAVANNLIFTNNIVNSFRVHDMSSGVVNHNLFLGADVHITNFVGEFRSNILASTRSEDIKVSTVGVGNTSHNTAATGQIGDDHYNNTSTPPEIFVGESGNSTDGQYRLQQDATAATGNAHDGTDRGPFGGELPYVLSGLPDLPVILTLQVPGAAHPSSTLSVTLRAISGH